MKRTAAALALLVLPACGGGDEEAAGAQKAAYVARGAEVCQRAKTDADGLTRPTRPADLAAFTNSSVAIARRAQGELAALSPPPQDAAELKTKVLDPFAALVSEGEAYAKKIAAAGTDQAALLTLISQQPTADGIDVAFLRSYGLGGCADVLEAR